MIELRRFSAREIELAIEMKSLDLEWEPFVGNYVFDATHAVKPSSPFQDRVYFLLNYDCFMQKVGGVARFKEIMTWLPTWSDARAILRSLGVSDAQVRQELDRTDAIENDNELLVLYELIAKRLMQTRRSPAAATSSATRG